MSRIALTVGLLLALVIHVVLLNGDITGVERENMTVIEKVTMRTLDASESNPIESRADPVRAGNAGKQKSPPAQPVPVKAMDQQLAGTTLPNRNSLDGSGDYEGNSQVERRPELRIDWGTSREAMDIVNAAELRLVMLSGQGEIVAEVRSEGDAWKRTDGRVSDLSRYSNRVRIVDSTPAFGSASMLRRGGERLAVLIPLAIEHMLKTEQIKSAAVAGVRTSRIRSFYGRFHLEDGRVAFAISELERRS